MAPNAKPLPQHHPAKLARIPMTNEEQILSTLQKILDVQTENLNLHRQTIDNQQKALSQNQASVQTYTTQARRQKVFQIIALVFMAFLLYKLFAMWK
jgi:hypothetical protein